LKQETLADDIGVGYNNIKQWMFHERFPPVYDVLKIAKTLNTSIEYLVNGEENKSLADPDSDKFFVPVLDQKLSAGFGQLLPDEPEIKGYMEVPRYLRQYGDNLAILSVEGDSMEPTLRRGDLVLCDSCGYDGEGLYAVQYDGDGFVKRVFRRAGKYVIMSDNPLYPQMEEPVGSDAIAIVGRVHGVFKRID
jgi:phage repressor protein C with HTH and peptisase S24 domain